MTTTTKTTTKANANTATVNWWSTSWRAVNTAAFRRPYSIAAMDTITNKNNNNNNTTTNKHDRYMIASRSGGTTSLRRINSTPPKNGSQLPTENTSLLLQVANGSNDGVQKEDNAPSSSSSSQSSSPKLLRWLWIALLSALAYALYNIYIKKGSSQIHPILGGVILQFVAAIMGATLLIGMVSMNDQNSKDSSNKESQQRPAIDLNRRGVYWSIGGGVWVGIAEITSFMVSGMGVPASHFIPINIGGSVAFGAVLGVVILGEQVMLWGWSGVTLLVSGIAMVATDPGKKVVEGESGTDVDDSAAPPLLVWIGPALFCAMAYALYNICIKKGSAYVNPIVGAVILQFVAALLGTIMLGVECWWTGLQPQFNAQGILFACLAGVFVGAAELLSFCVSGMGVPASQSIPIIIGGSVMFGAILGILMLGEELVLQGWLGVVILMAGIGLVATDPGEKVEE